MDTYIKRCFWAKNDGFRVKHPRHSEPWKRYSEPLSFHSEPNDYPFGTVELPFGAVGSPFDTVETPFGTVKVLHGFVAKPFDAVYMETALQKEALGESGAVTMKFISGVQLLQR